jgi:hypothetical protein
VLASDAEPSPVEASPPEVDPPHAMKRIAAAPRKAFMGATYSKG